MIREVQRDLKDKRRSAKEITEHYIDRLEKTEPQIGSFLALSTSDALRQAAAVDEAIAAGEPIGPLAGVPVAIKVCKHIFRPWRSNKFSRSHAFLAARKLSKDTSSPGG